MIAGFIHLVWKVIWNEVVVLVCSGLIFIGYKANQPMSVAGAPKGMTYVEFIQDRLEAAKNRRTLPMWLGNDAFSGCAWTDL